MIFSIMPSEACRYHVISMCERLDTIILCTYIKNEQVYLLTMGLTIIAYAWKKEKEK
jgi:hypothetical protein